MAGVYQITALKFPGMCIVVALALFVSWSGCHDFSREQFFDCLFDNRVVGRCRIENPGRDGALPKQLTCCGEFIGRLRPRCHFDAIH